MSSSACCEADMFFCCSMYVVMHCILFYLMLILPSCLPRSEYECFQIELAKNYGTAEWKEDIKSIMMKAGLQNSQITFLFVDTQVRLT